MSYDAALEEEMQLLWDRACLLKLSSPLDKTAAADIERKLRDCAIRARANNRLFGARQLEKMADELVTLAKASNS
jgi:hypothetical protein